MDSNTLKLLIVDSDSMIRELLTRILQRDGYVLATASTCGEAMAKLNADHIDFLITDVMKGEGIDLLERSRMLFPDILTIIISSPADINIAIHAIRLGAAGFVLKPFRVEEIRTSLKTARENRQMQEERGRLRILTQLVEAGREITASLNLDTLSRKIVEQALQITDADTASLMLIDPNRTEFYMTSSIGLEAPYAKGFRKSIDEGIAGWAVQRCFCLRMDSDTIVTPEVNNLMIRSNEIKSSICMPIMSEGFPYGVINVNRLLAAGKSAFNSSDVDFISILSSHAAVSIRNSELFHQVQNLYEGSIQALSNALQAKDTYTGGHSERVAAFTLLLAEKMGLNLSERQTLWTAAILHDLGKIGTPQEILNKSTALSNQEWQIIRTHPVIGADIVSSVPALKKISPIILHHHEWYDGSGYPGGLVGEQIPKGARILSVADALEAMTSDRPYRKNCSFDIIMNELVRGSGSQFDPDVVHHALLLIDEKKIVISKIDLASV